MSLFPGRSTGAIYIKLARIRGRAPRKYWSPEEKDQLLELQNNAGTTTLEMREHFPGRTHQSVLSQLSRVLPDSYFIDKKRVVSAAVLGKDGRKDGGHKGAQGNGAIVADVIRHIKPRTFWTEEEDDILRKLVHKAKERNPDRWGDELSRLLSDPKEILTLQKRTLAVTLKRLGRLETYPFLIKSTWLKDEDDLLSKAVYTQLGIQLELPSDPQSSACPETKQNCASPLGKRLLGLSEKLKEEKRWPKVSLEQLETVDWKRVALDVGTRNAYTCQRRFKSRTFLHKGKHWDEKEVERMKNGLRKYGRDWAKVASVVGTRTASQVGSKYTRLRDASTMNMELKDKT